VADVNIGGTANILKVARGARVVLASTCKAADPETAYGASKLIAERMVLNAGGTVARFHNVRQTQGNVFEIWANTPEPEPLTVMPCWRYFIDLDRALDLLLACATLPTGRYAVDPGLPVFIPDLADELYPARAKKMVPPRRGDRIREPLAAVCETVEPIPGGLLSVRGVHDPGGGGEDSTGVPFDLGAGKPARRVPTVA
jgi:FlaA1/EpsC-like NDP-sugar epimerase